METQSKLASDGPFRDRFCSSYTAEVIAIIPKYREPLVSRNDCPQFYMFTLTLESNNVRRLDVVEINRYYLSGLQIGKVTELTNTHLLYQGSIITPYQEFALEAKNVVHQLKLYLRGDADINIFVDLEDIGYIKNDKHRLVDIDIVGLKQHIDHCSDDIKRWYHHSLRQYEDIVNLVTSQKYSDYSLTPKANDVLKKAIQRLEKAGHVVDDLVYSVWNKNRRGLEDTLACSTQEDELVIISEVYSLM